MNRTVALCAVAVLLLSAGPIALAQRGFPLGLFPESTDPLGAYVWTMSSQFDVGDPIVIDLRVSRPAFVYLFDLQPDGVVRLLFPNAFSTDNYVTSTHRLPDGPYELIATPPIGVEELLVFATTAPLPFSATVPTEPFPVFASDAQGAIDDLVSLLAALDPTDSWGVGWTAIQIVGTAPQQDDAEPTVTLPIPPTQPPFVSAPGDAWHFADGWRPGIPGQGWYWYYGMNGRWHLCWVTDG